MIYALLGLIWLFIYLSIISLMKITGRAKVKYSLTFYVAFLSLFLTFFLGFSLLLIQHIFQ